LLAPGSQSKGAPYRTETVNGKPGFVPDFDTETIGLQRYPSCSITTRCMSARSTGRKNAA
jgi:hypothetical protein